MCDKELKSKNSVIYSNEKIVQQAELNNVIKNILLMQETMKMHRTAFLKYIPMHQRINISSIMTNQVK